MYKYVFVKCAYGTLRSRDFRLGYQLDRLHEMYPSEQSFYEKGQQLLKRLPELFSMLVSNQMHRVQLNDDTADLITVCVSRKQSNNRPGCFMYKPLLLVSFRLSLH